MVYSSRMIYSGFWLIVQLALAYFCYTDLQKHSDSAFESAGTPKQTALIIIIVGVFCWLGLAYYWFAIKPKVEAAEGSGGLPPA